VRPGVLEVLASEFLPTSALRRDDFPTFDLPMRANSGWFSSGHPETWVQLVMNSADLICMAAG